MCGIAGICALSGGLPSEAEIWVKSATDMMRHRGPDGSGVWCGEGVVLGHRRLSIIDLSTGAQPMSDASGQTVVTFNGEIYNFATVRKELELLGFVFMTTSDTEVILHGWRAWGAACVEHFEGMFAFALWDAREKTLFCARDRFGKKPFFYTMQQGRFYFASELSALAAIPGLVLTVARRSLMRYLAYEYVPTPECIYEQVRKLEPSYTLMLHDGLVQTRRYWDMPVPEATQMDENTAGEEVRRLLAQAVKKRMVSDVPLGALLSGGIDSTLVTGLMAQQSDDPIETFSIGFTEASYDESRYARAAADTYGTIHHERIFSADECALLLPELIARLDEPMADASVAPTSLLARTVREHVTVALGGDGADELWAGYEHYIAYAIAQRYNRVPHVLRKNMIEPLTRCLPASAGYVNPRLAVETFLRGAAAPDWLRVQTLLTACTPEMQQEMWLEPEAGFLAQERLFAPTKELFERWDGAAPLERAFYVYVRQYMLDDILTKVDRCSMFYSLEVRAPFLDTELVDFVARLPVSLKLHGFQRKYLLKKALADLLPPVIRKRNKRGFQIPVAAWLRGQLRPLVEELLGESFLREQGLFNPRAIRQMIDAHMSGTADMRKALWTLLVLQLWWQKNRPSLVA